MASSAATSASVTPRISAAKPGPSGMISIGESSAEFLICRTFLQNPGAGNRVFAKLSPIGMAALIAWTAFLFVLMILSRIEDRRRRRRFAPSLTRSSTRTIGSQAIKAALWPFQCTKSLTQSLLERATSNLDLPADLHEILRRKVEAVDRVDRVAIQKRKQPAPPGGESWLLLARHHAVAFAEIDRVVRIDRTVRFLPVQRHGDVRDLDKAEANGHVPKALA